MDINQVKLRSQVVKHVRQWFDEQGFTEMLTPRLVGLPGQEPYLDPFWTEVHTDNPLEKGGKGSFPAALITSPEYSMKRLLAAGLDKIYDLGSCFRNGEPWDGSHDPEFLMIEWYRRDSGLDKLMDDTEKMMRWVAGQISIFNLQSSKNSFRLPSSVFRRLTVEEAWRQYAGIELADYLGDRKALADLAQTKFRQIVTPEDDWDDIYFKIFLSAIEPQLGWSGRGTEDEARDTILPTFLYRYPASQASLARKTADDPRWAERVELYIGDLELANGFAELCDPDEQRKRFIEERELRSRQGKKSWALDECFLADLPKMGNAAGIAFGVERLAMLLAGTQSINDILPFPARERFRPLPELGS